MSTEEETCQVYVSFEDDLLGDPIITDLACSASSRLFPYYLRQKLHAIKRVPPFSQSFTKLTNCEYPNGYSMKIRQRNPNDLIPYTIQGHYFDEYTVFIDKKDTVMDIKFLLAPLVNHGNKAQDIQLNFNTVRRLEDNEIFYDTKCVGDKSIIIMFWFEFTNTNKGESPIYQSVNKLITVNSLYPDVATIIRRFCKEFGSHTNNSNNTTQNTNTKAMETFGYRSYLDKNDTSKRGNYEYINYDIITQRINNISVAIRNILNLECGNNKTMFGLCSINRREWLLCDYACTVSSIVTVPLYPTLDANAFEYITNHAKINVIATDVSTLPHIIELLDKCKPHFKYIILMDDELPDKLFIESEKGQNILNKYKNIIYLLSDLEKQARIGIDNGKYIVKDVMPQPDDLWTIMYTSGTTGNPKGVMLSHKNMASCVNAFLSVNARAKFPLPDGAEAAHLSYLPLAHSMERLLNLLAFMQGAKIGFYRGLVDGVIEDMQLIKPPVFMGVPRIFQKVQQTILNTIESKSFIAKKLFYYGYESKKRAILKRANLKGNIWDKLIFNKINQVFGGNIIGIGSGSAPLSADLQEFLKVCLAPQIGEGYGLTETTASGTGSHVYDLTFGHVGQPRINISLKLVDVPEMEYLTSDQPNPRGEIWMKGASIFKGYYKDINKTNEVLMNDGWFKTGDIGEWRKEGKLVIIDRKKNIFKLQQGEYIRPEYIQNCYKLSNVINNMFVYGDSYQNYLVGIIVPDFEALQHIDNTIEWNGQNENDILNDINKYKKIESIIKNDMIVQENIAKLNGFEKVKKFKLVAEDFTTENGLLTISMKLKRNAARKKYQKEIDEMYQIKSKL